MSLDHMEVLSFSELGNVTVALSEILDSTMVLYLSTISLLMSHCLECIPDIHDQGKMLVLPNQLVY